MTMKRILIFFTVLLFISCEDEKDDASNSNSTYVEKILKYSKKFCHELHNNKVNVFENNK